MENWDIIDEFPNYSVSDYGRVRNDNTDRILKHTRLATGYEFASMVNELGAKRRGVAKLVANAFVRNSNPHVFNTPIHLNGHLHDSAAANLLWRPRWFAVSYTQQFSLFDNTFPGVEDLRTGQVYPDVWDLIIERGILLREIIQSIQHHTHVFPTKDRFRWV